SLFPNPGRGEGSVLFSLPHRDDVRLAIYDIHGRRVIAQPSVNLASGQHVLTWNGRGLAAGVYHARLTTGSGESAHARWVKLR
ncbi:MAG: T9SS type A sorting domain-containing protein, partial [Gemmatimonadetes bacterium]|nr:T9SS type A sorting domain-containing protein [Gemmatimonadota bacterium]